MKKKTHKPKASRHYSSQAWQPQEEEEIKRREKNNKETKKNEKNEKKNITEK